MKSTNLQSAGGRLQDALDKLLLVWEHTRETWNDQQARTFEEEYLKTLVEEVNVAIPAISHMAQTIGHAGRECEE